MAYEFQSLFTPIRVGPLTLKNRIYSSGHAEAMAEDGRPTERLRRYHEAKARGGCALTIFGGSSSVHPSSPAAAWKQIANHDDSIIPAYRALADAVHRHDCLVFTQLTHLGRRAQSDPEAGGVLLAPSQIPERVHREIPHELEAEQIADLVAAFGDAARRCRDGGLDGIELSMAHNHLIDQFWSPLFNHRLDAYGGSLENRMRFGMDVLGEIRRQVGRDFVVGARISGDERTPGGLTTADLAAIARRLAASGLIDFLSIIGGGAHTYALQAAVVPNMSFTAGLFVPLAGAHQGGGPGDADLPRGAHRRSAARGADRCRWPGGRRRDDTRVDRRSRAAAQDSRRSARRHPDLRGSERRLHRPDLSGQAGHLRPESGHGA